MARKCFYLAIIVVLAGASRTPAQGFYGPRPFFPGGKGFHHHRHYFGVGGFYGPNFYYPAYPYSFVQSPVAVQVLAPTTVVVRPAPSLALGDYDLSGVDLDRVPASVIWGDDAAPRRGEAVRRPERIPPPIPEGEPAANVKPKPPAPAPRPEPRVPLVIDLPDRVEQKRPERVAPPRQKDAPPDDDDLGQPKDRPEEEAERLTELGRRAFHRGEYGLAGWRFRQATERAPKQGRPFFLLAQAQFALGKYRDAVRAVEQGLRLQPDWPSTPFRLRDLYEEDEDWAQQRVHLREALRARPADSDYLFLLGYLDWFDGRRAEAVESFRRARLTATDPRWIDLFLRSPLAPRQPA